MGQVKLAGCCRSICSPVNKPPNRPRPESARDLFDRAWNLAKGSDPDEVRAALQDELLVASLANFSPQEPPEQAPDVFVCYSWADKTRGARDVYEAVILDDKSAWIDEENRLDAEALNDHIRAAILRASIVAVCFSAEMLVRGGYALREVLLARSYGGPGAPRPILIVRLDESPLPNALMDLRSVDWFEDNGPRQLIVAIEELQAEHAAPALSGDAWSKSLLQGLEREPSESKQESNAARIKRQEFDTTLVQTARAVYAAHTNNDLEGVLRIVQDSLPQACCLDDVLLRAQPSAAGLLLRIRSGQCRARIHLGMREWDQHFPKAAELLDEILDLQARTFAPAEHLGWSRQNALLAAQDMLDLMHMVLEWLDAWKPRTLQSMCGIPIDEGEHLVQRTTECVSKFGDLMLALRILQDAPPAPLVAPSWLSGVEMSEYLLRNRLNPTSQNPSTQMAHGAMRKLLEGQPSAWLAVALAECTVRAAQGGVHQQERTLDLAGVTCRILVQGLIGKGNMQVDLEPLRGTLLRELRSESDSKTPKLTIALTGISVPSDDGEGWSGALRLTSMMSEQGLAKDHPLAVLNSPILMKDMLSPEDFDLVRKWFPFGEIKDVF